MRLEDFPNLWESLGKPGSDRVRNHVVDRLRIGGPRTRWVQNPYQEFMQDLGNYTKNSVVDDILSAIAKADSSGDKIALSAERLYVLLSYNKRLSTDLIRATMALEERQARRYMAAAKLAVYLLSRAGVVESWEIEDLIDNVWLIEPVCTEHPKDYSQLQRRSPTLAEIRAAHAAQTK